MSLMCCDYSVMFYINASSYCRVGVPDMDINYYQRVSSISLKYRLENRALEQTVMLFSRQSSIIRGTQRDNLFRLDVGLHDDFIS